MDKNCSEYPFNIEDLEEPLNGELKKLFSDGPAGFIRIGPKGYFFPQRFKDEASDIYNMQIRSSDVIVTGFPRSGTTWVQQLVWLVVNDLAYEKSNASGILEQYTILEVTSFFPHTHKDKYVELNKDSEEKLKSLELISKGGVEMLALKPSPRYLKSHLPFSLLPPTLLDTAKVVYIARDPRDVVVSFYHLSISPIFNYVGDFKTFWNNFRNDLYHWAPYFENLKESWSKRNHPNLLFLFYEELLKDLPSIVHRVAAFYNKQFTEEQVASLCEHLSFDKFKSNKAVNYEVLVDLGVLQPESNPFIRKGKAGGWRDYFDADMTREAERWIADNLRDTDLRFPSMENIPL